MKKGFFFALMLSLGLTLTACNSNSTTNNSKDSNMPNAEISTISDKQEASNSTNPCGDTYSEGTGIDGVFWWLRSSGQNGIYVMGVTSGDSVAQNYCDYPYGSIRPAMYITR